MKTVSYTCILIASFLTFASCKDDNPTQGCTDTNACNFDVNAEENDGSCYSICLSETERATVIDFVNSAIDYLENHDVSDAITAFSAPSPAAEYITDELYIFLLDIRNVENQEVPMLAHGANENLIGENQYDQIDQYGKYFVQEFLQLLESNDTAWSWYYWTDPSDSNIKKKFSYIVKSGDYIIGAGIFVD